MTVAGGRLRAALAASALVHGLAILLVARVGSGPSRPPLVAFSVSQVAGTGSAGEAAAPGSAETPATASAAAPPPTPTPHRRAPRRREGSRTATGEASASSGAQGVVPGNGAGAGAGAGGDGGTGAAYGANPLPPYPLVARRLGMEGVVLLEVLVASDGHAADVRVAKSSGYPALDESALTTVRERWRFIPAHRDGVPVESRVTVPIRFRLEA